MENLNPRKNLERKCKAKLNVGVDTLQGAVCKDATSTKNKNRLLKKAKKVRRAYTRLQENQREVDEAEAATVGFPSENDPLSAKELSVGLGIDPDKDIDSHEKGGTKTSLWRELALKEQPREFSLELVDHTEQNVSRGRPQELGETPVDPDMPTDQPATNRPVYADLVIARLSQEQLEIHNNPGVEECPWYSESVMGGLQEEQPTPQTSSSGKAEMQTDISSLMSRERDLMILSELSGDGFPLAEVELPTPISGPIPFPDLSASIAEENNTIEDRPVVNQVGQPDYDTAQWVSDQLEIRAAGQYSVPDPSPILVDRPTPTSQPLKVDTKLNATHSSLWTDEQQRHFDNEVELLERKLREENKRTSLSLKQMESNIAWLETQSKAMNQQCKEFFADLQVRQNEMFKLVQEEAMTTKADKEQVFKACVDVRNDLRKVEETVRDTSQHVSKIAEEVEVNRARVNQVEGGQLEVQEELQALNVGQTSGFDTIKQLLHEHVAKSASAVKGAQEAPDDGQGLTDREPQQPTPDTTDQGRGQAPIQNKPDLAPSNIPQAGGTDRGRVDDYYYVDTSMPVPGGGQTETQSGTTEDPLNASIAKMKQSGMKIELTPWQGKTDYSGFLEKYESYCRFWELDEPGRLLALKTIALDESVLAVVARYPPGDRDTSAKVLQILENKWGEAANRLKYVGELQRKQGPKESLDEYAERIENSAAYAYKTLTEKDSEGGELLVEWFIQGLGNEAIKDYLLDHHPRTLKQAREMAVYRQNRLAKLKPQPEPAHIADESAQRLLKLEQQANQFSSELNSYKEKEKDRFNKWGKQYCPQEHPQNQQQFRNQQQNQYGYPQYSDNRGYVGQGQRGNSQSRGGFQNNNQGGWNGDQGHKKRSNMKSGKNRGGHNNTGNRNNQSMQTVNSNTVGDDSSQTVSNASTATSTADLNK